MPDRKKFMRAAPILIVVVAVVAGCGAATHSRSAGQGSLSAYGLSIDLPSSWAGRIVLGQRGLPVLHATASVLPPDDSDSGEMAREALTPGVYLNVRDLGPGDGSGSLPVSFSASEFEQVESGMGGVEASHDIVVGADRYRITAFRGRRTPPPEAALAEANAVLATLRIEPYVPVSLHSLPDDATRISGYGISMRLPSGWHGEITRGKVVAEKSSRLGRDDMRLTLLEHPMTDGGWYFTGRPPIRLSDAEFIRGAGDVAPAITGRVFADHGRWFVLSVQAGSFRPSAQLVEQANEALATLTVEPGDFYPGSVEPATFAAADGWHTGTSGPAKVQPDVEQTHTWASTIPYLDEPFQFPPSKTLDRLPPDGIIIDVQLFGRTRGRAAELPFRIDGVEPGSFEGLPPEAPAYGVGGVPPGQHYNVEVMVLFGRSPTPDQVAAADAELARLHLPDWGSG
jgi:hypothetical protein